MNLLKINARTPADQLAEELGIDAQELAARMDNLEKAGYRRKKTKSGILIYGLRLKSGQDFLN